METPTLPRLLWSRWMALLLIGAFNAQAHVYFVTDTNDSTAITSLRGAVMAANRDGGHNTIVLGQQRKHEQGHPQADQWTYYLTIAGANEDQGATGDLDVIRGSMTIVGVATNVTIDATGLGDRAFHVLPRAQLNLQNLTITGGVCSGGGGGIYNGGALSVDHCIINNNSGDDGDFDDYIVGPGGGGILNTGIMTIYYSTVVGNAGGGEFSPGGDGGGIYNAGRAALNSCTVGANCGGLDAVTWMMGGLPGGNGGGIYNCGSMTLSRCSITNNSGGAGWGLATGGGGGGVYNAGKMSVDSSTISGNAGGLGGYAWSSLGEVGGRGGSGGGVYNVGTLSLRNSTISGNRGGTSPDIWWDRGGPGGLGGGIFNAGELELISCTVTLNQGGTGGNGGVTGYAPNSDGGPGGAGGGILNHGKLTLTFCTITLNEAGAGGNGGNVHSTFDISGAGGLGGDGGGVMNAAAGWWLDLGYFNGGETSIRNTLVALNSPGPGGLAGANLGEGDGLALTGNPGVTGNGPDLVGAFHSFGFNLVGMADGSTGVTNGVRADQAGSAGSPINPLIGPLQMNGGFTATHALLPGSPAIDQGNSFGIHQDQRGYRRPYDYHSIPNAPGGDGSDIGAFELGPAGRRQGR